MTARVCAWCGGSMQGKRSHAIYCTRSCKAKATHARLRKDNPQERERNRRRYLKERGKRIAGAVDYHRRNPHVAQVTKRNRKAKLRATDSRTITPKDWRRVCLHYRMRCAYCDEQAPLTIDHVIPLARGGRHAIGNVVPACMSCNCRKRSRLLIEWKRDQQFSRRAA